jgi:hypothetical protein
VFGQPLRQSGLFVFKPSCCIFLGHLTVVSRAPTVCMRTVVSTLIQDQRRWSSQPRTRVSRFAGPGLCEWEPSSVVARVQDVANSNEVRRQGPQSLKGGAMTSPDTSMTMRTRDRLRPVYKDNPRDLRVWWQDIQVQRRYQLDSWKISEWSCSNF